MTSPNRIRTQRYVPAMVALDTVDLLAERVQRLLSHGRRMAMTQRYTYTQQPPELYVGLTLRGAPDLWDRDGAKGFAVRLQPGILCGFGFAAHGYEGSATEAEAWKRYHAAKADSPDFFERRRNMTLVEITGGLADPGREDRIVIQAWNDDGVCDERVISFDNTREDKDR